MSIEPEPRRQPGIAPLAPLAMVAMVGVVVDRFLEPLSTFGWSILAMAGALVAILTWRRSNRSSLAILVGMASLAAAWHHHRWSDLDPDDLGRVAWTEGERRPVWVRGIVVQGPTFRKTGELPGNRGSTKTVLALTALNEGQGWRPASGRVATVITGDRSDLVVGKPVESAGAMFAVESPSNPGEFDPRPYYRAQGIRLKLSVDAPSGVWDDPGGKTWLMTWALGSVRLWSQKTLEQRLDPEVAPLASALLLGRREAVDPEVNDAFARTGTTHLLAISGLHLVVLSAALGTVVRGLGMGRNGSFLVVAVGTAVYAILVGLAPSVVRSAAMTLTFCFAGCRDRHARPANTLSLAALMTLAWNPSDLFDVGCQLSFLAVGAIVWLVPSVLAWDAPELTRLDVLERRLEPWYRALRRMGLAYVRAGLIASAVVWLAAWPLVTLRFHLVSPVGILINLPLIPLTSLALMLAGISLLLSTTCGPLGALFGWLCGKTLVGTEAIVRLATSWRWGHGFVPGPSWPFVLIFYGFLGMATIAGVGRWRSSRGWWTALIVWSVVGLVATLIPSHPKSLEADVLAVGHGLAVVIRSPEGKNILYDCGKQGDPHVGRRIIAPALWSMGVRRLDAIILTHPDMDHYNGLPDLLDRFEVEVVRAPPGFGSAANPGAKRLLDGVRARGIPVEAIAEGDQIDLGGGSTLLARHPRSLERSSTTDNARSVVLEVASGGRTLLLTGDLERDGLTTMASQTPPPSGFDAMLAPHHGGRTSNPASFYQWARPGLVVVSQNRPSNPSRDPLVPLAQGHFPLLRTWQTGSIHLKWEPAGLVATGFLDPAKLPWIPSVASLIPGSSELGWIELGVLGGLVLGLVITVAEWGAWSLVMPGRRLVTRSEGHDAGIPIETIARDGIRLAGSWFPTDLANGRTLILLHGLAEDRQALLGRVPPLLRIGWNVAALDARASGESGGRLGSFGGVEADDLATWMDVLRSRVDHPPTFVLWGRSMGAASALKAAASDPRIAGLILEAPYHDLKSSVAAVLRRMRIPGGLASLILLRARIMTGTPLDRPRPIDLAPRVNVPTLILHGELDLIAPLADARRLARSFPRPIEIIEVQGAAHANVVGVGGDTLMNRIGAFLDGVSRPVPENHPRI